MTNIDRVIGFDWDDGNRHKSDKKHGVTPAEAEQVFLNEPILLVEDTRHSAHEARFHALGRTDDGKFLHITFTFRRENTLIRVISARAMNRQERACYEKEA